MPNILHDLELMEVSLVEEGANPGAHILMTKNLEGISPSDETEDRANAPESVDKSEESTMSDDLEKRVEALEAENADLKKSLEESVAALEGANAALEEATKSAEAPAEEAEDVVKFADLPEGVQKALADAEAAKAELAKMKDKELTATWIGKAKDAKVGDSEAVGDMLKTVAGFDEALADSLLGVLKAAGEQIEKGALFDEVGKSGGDAMTAADKLEKIAEDIAKAEGVTLVKARTLAIDRNRDLVHEIRNGK